MLDVLAAAPDPDAATTLGAVLGATVVGAFTFWRDRALRRSNRETVEQMVVGNGELRAALEWEREERERDAERHGRERVEDKAQCAAEIAELRGEIRALQRVFADDLADRIANAIADRVHRALNEPDRRKVDSPTPAPPPGI